MIHLAGLAVGIVGFYFWLKGHWFAATLAMPVCIYGAFMIHGLGINPSNPSTMFGEVGSILVGVVSAWIPLIIHEIHYRSWVSSVSRYPVTQSEFDERIQNYFPKG